MYLHHSYAGVSGTTALRLRTGLTLSAMSWRDIPSPSSPIAHALRPLQAPIEPPGDSATKRLSGLTGLMARRRVTGPAAGDPIGSAGLSGLLPPADRTL